MLSIVIAVTLIVVVALLPVYAWPVTRSFALPVLFCYALFLLVHHDFVLGVTGVYHDSFWSTELFATILRQWLESGNEFGWNPYIGGGQPIAIFNNLLNVFPTFFCFYLFELFGLDLSGREFFNLVFLFSFFNVCTGSLLLIRLLNSNPYICLLGFGSLLFGGMFQSELGCPLGLMYLAFLPYLLFFLIHFYKSKRMENVLFFFLLLGMSASYYIPLYHAIAIGIFMGLALLACIPGIAPDYKERVSTAAKAFLSHPKAMVIGVVLFTLAAGSAFYSYAETRDYVSPTRGFTQGGKLGEKSYISSVAVLPGHYKKIADFYENRPEDVYIATHTAFYLGVLPALGFLASLFLIRNHLFTALAVSLAILSLGEQTPVWNWMVENVPLLDMLRNAFPFGRLTTWCVLVGGLLGLSALLDEKVPLARKILAILAAASILKWVSSISLTVYLFLSVLALVLVSVLVKLRRPGVAGLCGFWLLLVAGVQLTGYTIHAVALTEVEKTTPPKISEFKYPASWQVYPSQESPMPFNLYPFLNKEAAWSVHHPAYAFYLQKDFADYLVEEKLFPVEVGDLSQKYLIDGDKLNDHSGPLFQILPKDKNWRLLSTSKLPLQPGELNPYPSTHVSELKVQVDMREEGVLWRLENYDPNWKAWVDGKETPIKTVPPNFQAIPLEAGRHEVLFKYDSPYHFLLYGHVLIGVLGMACFIVWLRKPDFVKGLCRL